MTKERKEQIIDDYIKSIKHYLNVGLCEGQANGSYGEDLMRHFDIIAECFKEMTLLEHDLGIDLTTLIKVLDAVCKQEYLWTKYNDELDPTNDVVIGDDFNGLLFIYFYWDNGKHLVFYLKDYGKSWALTKEELEK